MLPMIILQITSAKEVAGRKPCAEQTLELEIHWQIIVRAWSKDCRSNICWDTKEWMASNLTQIAIWSCHCCGYTPKLSLALLDRLVADANCGSCQWRHSSRGLLVREEVGVMAMWPQPVHLVTRFGSQLGQFSPITASSTPTIEPLSSSGKSNVHWAFPTTKPYEPNLCLRSQNWKEKVAMSTPGLLGLQHAGSVSLLLGWWSAEQF